MEISNPRRILAVSLESEAALLSRFIKDLTGTHPEPSPPGEGDDAGGDGGGPGTSGLAGTTHALPLKTAYYTASVPVWLDTISASTSPTPAAAPSASEWASSFLLPEAKEVLEALGGVVVVFPLHHGGPAGEEGRSGSVELISGVGRIVKEGLGGWEWDGVGLAVGVGEVPPSFAGGGGGGGGESGDFLGAWEECCAGAGLEFVHARPGGHMEGARNEFGEKTGIPRVLEALESNDWTLSPSSGLGFEDEEDDMWNGDNDDDGEFGDFADASTSSRMATDLDPSALDFGFDRADFEGLKKAIWTSGVEAGGEDVDDVRAAAGAASSQMAANPPEPRMTDEGETKSGAAARDGGDDNDIDKEDVEKLEGMMRKLLAARELGAGLPEEQRKRLAARAVGEVMRDLN